MRSLEEARRRGVCIPLEPVIGLAEGENPATEDNVREKSGAAHAYLPWQCLNYQGRSFYFIQSTV